MSGRPTEVTEVHTRILNCGLEVEGARAYWPHALNGVSAEAASLRAFEECWFGSRSLSRVRLLMANMRARFDAYPESLQVQRCWADMSPDTRRLICHWHLQLSDPLYRVFTGAYLPERHGEGRAEVRRDLVVAWVDQQQPGRWNMATRIQFASKLLSAAFGAGLIASRRDPRPLQYPRVGDEALTYLLYLLRGTAFEGTMLANPYVFSVGLAGRQLEDRLRGLPAVRFGRQGDVVDFGWVYGDLGEWARETIPGCHGQSEGA